MSAWFRVFVFLMFDHDVICVDKDPAKMEKLNRASSPNPMSPAFDDLMAQECRLQGAIVFNRA